MLRAKGVKMSIVNFSGLRASSTRNASKSVNLNPNAHFLQVAGWLTEHWWNGTTAGCA
jgi:hypothetical protein